MPTQQSAAFAIAAGVLVPPLSGPRSLTCTHLISVLAPVFTQGIARKSSGLVDASTTSSLLATLPHSYPTLLFYTPAPQGIARKSSGLVDASIIGTDSLFHSAGTVV